MSDTINHTRTEKLLLEAARIFNSTLEYEELMEAVLQLVTTAVDCEGAMVFRVDHNRTDVKIRFSSQSDPSVRTFHREFGAGLSGWVARYKEPVIVNDAAHDPRVDGEIEHHSGLKIRSLLCVPLIGRGQMIGVVEAINKLDGEFTPEDLDSLIGLNNQMAVAIDNAHLYRELKREALEKNLLYEVGKNLSGRLSLNETMQEIIDSLKQVTDFIVSGIFLVDAKNSDVCSIYTDGYKKGSDDKIQLKFGQGLVGHVATTGEPIIVADVSKDDRYVCANDATRSEIVLPIKIDSRLIGVINLESDQVNAYNERTQALISAFAAQAAISIDRAQVHEQLLERNAMNEQLNIARQIQRDFLPHQNPVVEGYDISGQNISLGQVGGDYYDFIKIIPGQTGIAIADVSGKGVPAALIMAAYRASLIAEIRNNYAIWTIMDKVNRLLCESLEPGNYVTALYGVLDSKEHQFTYCNAGHNQPILLHADGSVDRLIEGGPVLGVTEMSQFSEGVLSFDPGDLLVLFTDGVTEVFDENDEQFGEERLIELLKANQDKSAGEIQKIINEAVTEFASDHHLFDDLTLVVLKRN